MDPDPSETPVMLPVEGLIDKIPLLLAHVPPEVAS